MKKKIIKTYYASKDFGPDWNYLRSCNKRYLFTGLCFSASTSVKLILLLLQTVLASDNFSMSDDDLSAIGKFFIMATKENENQNQSSEYFLHARKRYLPEDLFTNKGLKEIEITGRKLNAISDKIAKLTELRKIKIYKTSIEHLPDSITKCCKLNCLILEKNCLIDLPNNIGFLKFLETLSVNDNCLSELPATIRDCTNLKSLDLRKNNISNIPDIYCKYLEYIDLSNNALIVWPHYIVNLPKLKILNLSENNLTYLPEDLIRNLACSKFFECLDVSYNKNFKLYDSRTNLGYISIKEYLKNKVKFDKSEEFLEIHRKNTESQKLSSKYDKVMNYIQYDNSLRESLWLKISRKNIIQDTISEIMACTDEKLKKSHIRIKFTGENSSDDGGLIKDWLDAVSTKFMEPKEGYFKRFDEDDMSTVPYYTKSNVDVKDNIVYKTKTTLKGLVFKVFKMNKLEPENIQTNTVEKKHAKESKSDIVDYKAYECLGRLCGLALTEKHTLNLNLHESVYKFLTGEKITLINLKKMNPVLYNSLSYLLNHSVEDQGLDFTLNTISRDSIVETIDLKPNGASIKVTDENKEEFIELYIEHIYYGTNTKELTAMKKGLLAYIEKNLIEQFNSSELEIMLCGRSDINTSDLLKNINFSGYKSNDNVVIWFKQIIGTFSLEDKIKFMHFVTGSSRRHFKKYPHITVEKISTLDKFPTSSTCINTLWLCDYSSFERMKFCLMTAITEANEGFI